MLKNKNEVNKYLYRHRYLEEPIEENWVMFETFMGKSYADSPKYIYEYLAKNYKESYFMHISNYVEGTIEAADPDVIVITSTERAFPGLHWSIDSILEKM